MITALFLPNLPAHAAQAGLGVANPVIIVSNGCVVSPLQFDGQAIIGIPASRASALFPNVPVLQQCSALEHGYWHRVLDVVYSITPLIVEQGRGRLLCSPDDVPRLRRLIQATEAQAGFAATRTLAMLAAVSARPGSIVAVDEDDVAGFLETLDVGVLQQLRPSMLDHEAIERLRLFGLSTVGRLRLLTRRHLQAQFGEAGVHVHALMQSVSDHSPLSMYQPPPVISARERFDDEVNEPQVLIQAMDVCLDHAMALLERRRVTRLDVAMLDRADAPAWQTTRLLRMPMADKGPLLTQASTMMLELAAKDRKAWGVAIRLAALLPPAVDQLPLFQPRASASQIAVPLSKRYPNAIKRIQVVDPHAYLPEKFFRYTEV